MKKIVLVLLFIANSLLAYDWKVVIPYTSDLEFKYITSFNNISFAMGGFASDIAVEDVVRIYKSTNYGKSWSLIYKSLPYNQQEPPGMTSVYQGFSVNPEYHYFSSFMWSILQKSSDGGKTFKRIVMDTSRDYNSTLYSIAMYDTNHGIVFGDKYFYTTIDGWANLVKHKKNPDQTYYSPIFFDSLTAGMIYFANLRWNDYKGMAYVKYHFNENKWDTLFYFARDSMRWNDAIKDIYFVNDSLGFGCGHRSFSDGIHGYDDIIYRTRDGGHKWDLVHREAKIPQDGLSDITFYDEKRGLAVGKLGKICMTKDGGDTWVYDELPDPDWQKFYLIASWAGKYPLISTLDAGIYRYEGDFFDIPPDTVLPQILADDKYFENTDYRDAVGRTVEISIRNKSSLAYLEITSSSNLSSPAFTTTGLPKIDSINTIVIPPDSSFKFKVRFKPTAIGLFADSIIFHSNATGTDSLVYLIGEGIDTTTSVVDDLTGVNSKLFIKPNPAMDKIEISFHNGYGIYPMPEEIRVYNIYGEKVLSKFIQNSERNILDISSLPPGLYFVRYGSEYGKFIKE